MEKQEITLTHFNEKSGRTGRCRAIQKPCPLGGLGIHLDSAEKMRGHLEQIERDRHGLFGEGAYLSLERDAVRNRLGILSDETFIRLRRKVYERTMSTREAAMAESQGMPFYVGYGDMSREVTLDFDSPQSVHCFSHGACGFLAAEIHRATGWPIVVSSIERGGTRTLQHVTVRTPNGEHLEIGGTFKSPSGSFSGRGEFVVDEYNNLEEFTREAMKAPQGDTLYEGLTPLERGILAKFAFDLLDSEGYLL